MSEVKDLPGRPTLKRVRDVKRILRTYVQCRPQADDECWRLAWEWAAFEAEQSLMFQFGKSRRKRWPSEREIASRFLLLCLVRMKSHCQLHIGLVNKEKVPFSVNNFLAREAKFIAMVRKDFGIEDLETVGPLGLITK